MAKHISIVNKLKQEETISFSEGVGKEIDIERKSTLQDNFKVEKELNYMGRTIEQINAPPKTKVKDAYGESPTLKDMKIHEELFLRLIFSPFLSVELKTELSKILKQSPQFPDPDFELLEGTCWSIVDRILNEKALVRNAQEETLENLSTAIELIEESETPNKQAFLERVRRLRSLLEEAAKLKRNHKVIELLKSIPK